MSATSRGRAGLTLRFVVVAALVLGSLAGCFAPRPPESRPSYDVVVVGAEPGGIAAAIQAARMGDRVALLEPTDWIGGQMAAAGVGTMDEGSPAARESGLYHEFVQRVEADYGARHLAIGTCYYSTTSLCVDPRDGQEILRAMLGEQAPNLDVFTGQTVVQVMRSGDVVTGVATQNATYSARVVIDADPEGDVLAMSGAQYRLGNATTAGEAPVRSSCIQDVTWSAIMKRYPQGVPDSLVMKAPPPHYDAAVAAHFAKVLRADAPDLAFVDGRIQVPHPASFSAYAAYRGLPDAENGNLSRLARTALNFGNDAPMVGDLSTRYVTDASFRAEMNSQAKLLTLQLVYYIQHDLGERNWSIADDEGYDTAYNRAHRDPALAGFEAFEDQLPQEAYVREARRVVGVETLTGNALSAVASHGPTHLADSIAVGYFPMDLHGCKASLEPALDSPNATSPRSFEVPMGILIPATLDGLLATDNNAATSREANGATREQPIAMAIGQAAGVLAATSVARHVPPRDVPAADVQAALVAAHAVIHAR